MAVTKVLALDHAAAFLFLPGYVQATARAEDSCPEAVETLTDSEVDDRFSVQLVSGVLYSPVIENGSRPNLNYLQTNLRFVWMLTPEKTTKRIGLKENFDFIFELTTSIILKGPGNVISGVTGLLRYDLPPSHERFRCCLQAGAGIVYTNAHEDLLQSLIGNPIEFTPQFSVGAHFLLDKTWSVDGEVMFHHISNAGIDGDRNIGVNALGAFIGVSLFFRKCVN